MLATITNNRPIKGRCGPMVKQLQRENNALKAELNRLTHVVGAVHHATVGLMNQHSIKDTLESILCSAADILHIKDGYIYLLDDKNKTMEMEIGIGLYQQNRIYGQHREGKGFAGAVWRRGEILLLKDYSTWPERLADPWLDCLREVVGVPLKVGNEIRGIFVLCAHKSQKFTENDILQMQRFGEISSLALANAYYYEEMAHELKQRQAAERELYIYAERLRAIINSAADYIFIKDIQGRYQVANPAMGLLCNAPREAIPGRTAMDFFEPEAARKMSQTDQQVLQGASITEEIQVVRERQLRVYQQIKSPLRSSEGDTMGICCIGRDITAQRKMEQELSNAKDEYAKMERLISLVVFNAAISHEINQPLNFIKMAASSLLYWQKQGVNKPYQEIMEDVSDIYRQTQRIEEVINNFRRIAKLNHSDKADGMELCHLPDILNGCQELIDKKFNGYGVELKLKLEEKIPLVRGTRMGLQQIITNLLSNAIEACREVPRGMVDLSIFKEAGKLVIEIKDNGPGFMPDNHAKLFNPFFSTKQHGGNMGLGLALVQYFIQLYEGRIALLNNYPPPGGLCRVEFPIAAQL